MTIFVFGNPDVSFDCVPIKIVLALKERFPEITFEIKDPNEDWDVGQSGETLTVLDTAIGIKDVTIFDSIDSFTAAPRISMHDFDALANMRLMIKLGKIKNVRVIGVPANMLEAEAFKKVADIITGLI